MGREGGGEGENGTDETEGEDNFTEKHRPFPCHFRSSESNIKDDFEESEGEGIAGEVMATGQTIAISDTRTAEDDRSGDVSPDRQRAALQALGNW